MEWLPTEVQRLAPREGQLATLIYLNGPMTAKDLQVLVSPLSVSAVRTMLDRLVAKRIVKRRGGDHSYRQLVYAPAIMNGEIKRRALKQLARNYFGGSLAETAATLSQMIEHRA
jgi:predicted transcriptional regulator